MDTSLIMLGAAECGKCCGPLVKSHPHLVAAGLFVAGALVGFICAKMFGGKKSSAAPAASSSRQASAGKSASAARRQPEMRTPIPAGSVEIYVGNLSYDMNDDQLRKAFEAFGKVDSARVVLNRFNGRSKGFGFVVMPNRPEAEAAIAALNNKDVLGRAMHVNEAKNTIKEQE